MSDVITTINIIPGFSEVEKDFVLCEEPMSRLVFRAQIHTGGIRGKIIRYRRVSKDDTWEPDKGIKIRTLTIGEGFNLEVPTDAVNNFYLAILQLQQILKEKGIEYGEQEYIVADPQNVVAPDKDKATIIRKLLEAGYREDVWENLLESNPNLATKLSYARIQTQKQAVIEELNSRLSTGGFSETSGPDSWQEWVYKNNWLFGVNYRAPIQKAKVNLGGSMPDYMFPTLDGFVDVLEIKLPDDQVILEDSSHRGSWRWSSETNSAIGQVVNYLEDMGRLQSEIEKETFRVYGYELCFIRPRAFILIGNNSDWTQQKKEALRKLNHALHGMEVITYGHLRDRGQSFIYLPRN